jgi:sugar phosphate isomerase/epimerase
MASQFWVTESIPGNREGELHEPQNSYEGGRGDRNAKSCRQGIGCGNGHVCHHANPKRLLETRYPAGDWRRAPLTDWEGLARSAARLGDGGVDLPLIPSLQAGEEKVRAVLSELKLKTGFIAGRVNPFSGDDATFQAAVKDFDDHCRFVRAIGCPRITLVMRSSSDTPKDDWRKITLDRAKAMSVSMERHRVQIGFEFLGPLHFRRQFKYEFIYKMPDAVEFCKDAGPNWGICLDAWHWYHAGGSYDDIIAAGKSRINVVHISDAKVQPRKR